MTIGNVIGEMISTERHPSLRNLKLLIVQPLSIEGEPAGKSTIAVDSVDAGVGDRVLLTNEGRAAVDILGLDYPPIRTMIVAVLDTIETGGKTVYRISGR